MILTHSLERSGYGNTASVTRKTPSTPEQTCKQQCGLGVLHVPAIHRLLKSLLAAILQYQNVGVWRLGMGVSVNIFVVQRYRRLCHLPTSNVICGHAHIHIQTCQNQGVGSFSMGAGLGLELGVDRRRNNKK